MYLKYKDMKKIAFSVLFLLTALSVFAQETATDTIKFWTKKGTISP
jgi:hypothetical protein